MPIGPLLARSYELAKVWSEFNNELEACFIKGGTETNGVLDPFCVRRVLFSLENRPTIMGNIDQSVLTKIRTWTVDQCKFVEQTFESQLKQFCDINNIRLDGHFPSYMLNGFLRLRVNAAKGSCDIGGQQIDTMFVDSFSSILLTLIKEERQRPFEKAKFIEELYSAYNRAILISKMAAGTALPVKDVFMELVMIKQPSKFARAPSRINFQDYSREFFLRDLAKLVGAGSLATSSGKRLILAPTAFSADAFPIIEPNGIRYIGRIAFSDPND